jgi:Zn-dependent peptidase ImmA (M78 family)
MAVLDGRSVVTIRYCTVCGHELEPFFDSPCEDPAAWLCQTCRNVQMDVPRPSLSPEARRELEVIEAFMGVAGSDTPPAGRARARARAVLEGVREIPVDVERLAEQLGYPIRERTLPTAERGTIGRDGAHTVIVLNRDRVGHAEAERRWVIAEELGHAILEHSTLVASSAPGGAPAVAEPRRRVEEREAKTFAAEILMPEGKIRARFGELAPRISRALGLRQRQTETDEVVSALARMFGVSATAMRVRLEELDLLR